MGNISNWSQAVYKAYLKIFNKNTKTFKRSAIEIEKTNENVQDNFVHA